MWISLSLSYLGFTRFLELVSLCLPSNLGRFQPLFLQILSLASHSLFSPSQLSNDRNVRSLVIVPELSESLLIFSHFSLLFTLSKFYLLVFKFTDAIICCVHSTTESTKWVSKKNFTLYFQFYNFHLVL